MAKAPRDLCPPPAQQKPGADTQTAEGVRSATVHRDRHWVVITVNHRDVSGSSTRRTLVSATRERHEPVDLGCGRALLLIPPSPSGAGLPAPAARIVAEVGTQRTELDSRRIEVVDYREDWDGGSGGTSVEAQLKNGWLEVTTIEVSPNSAHGEFHAHFVEDFDLSAFEREEVVCSVARVVFTAIP